MSIPVHSGKGTHPLLCLKYLGEKPVVTLATHSREVSHNLVCSSVTCILVSFIEDTSHVFGPKNQSVSNFAISDYQSIPKYIILTFHPNSTESWAELPAMRKSCRSFVFLSLKSQLISDLWRSYGTFRGFGVI